VTDLSGRIVRFYLSPEARKSLGSLVPVKGSFQALVIGVTDLGPLVWRRMGKADEKGRRKCACHARALGSHCEHDV